MKKLTYALVLAVFSFNCCFAWAMLTPLLEVRNAGRVLPYFTDLCINLRPLLLFLPIVAMAYGLWLWFRGAEDVPASARFTVSAMAVLILFVFPVMLTSYWLFLSPLKSLAMR